MDVGHYSFEERAAELAAWNSTPSSQPIALFLPEDLDDEDGPSLNDATDLDLLRIEGIGIKTLRRMREAMPFGSWEEVRALVGQAATGRLREVFDLAGTQAEGTEPAERLVCRATVEIPEKLTAREGQVYAALARRVGEVVDAFTIAGETDLAYWLEPDPQDRRNPTQMMRSGVATAVSGIRRKLTSERIETCWGKGYRLA